MKSNSYIFCLQNNLDLKKENKIMTHFIIFFSVNVVEMVFILFTRCQLVFNQNNYNTLQ